MSTTGVDMVTDDSHQMHTLNKSLTARSNEVSCQIEKENGLP